MATQTLTSHQRGRARFASACHAAGKLQHADPQIWREMRAFASRYPREPIVRRLTRIYDRVERGRAPRSRRTAPRSRRTRTARAARAGPLADGEPEPAPVARLRGFAPASLRMVRHIERCLGARAA
jgi:hypothetical protein